MTLDEALKEAVVREICEVSDKGLGNLDRVRATLGRREHTTHAFAMMVVLGMRAAGRSEEDVREILEFLYDLSLTSADALAKHVRDHEYRIVDEEGRE